jgi:hypothetical protein
MDRLIWCEKYKLNVNPEWDGNCPSCIFSKKVIQLNVVKALNEIYYKCIYVDWVPGLKGKNVKSNI